MDNPLDEDIFSDRVQPITVPVYVHTEAGLPLTLREMTLYLLDEKDFGISPEDFRPEAHEHAIPKFEMARVYILVCALTGDSLGFTPKDRNVDPVYDIYEKAYQKLVRTETDKTHFLGIARVGHASGFLSENQLSH